MGGLGGTAVGTCTRRMVSNAPLIDDRGLVSVGLMVRFGDRALALIGSKGPRATTASTRAKHVTECILVEVISHRTLKLNRFYLTIVSLSDIF